MYNRLLLFWRRFCAWLLQAPPAHHESFSEPYRPSNLHARRYR